MTHAHTPAISSKTTSRRSMLAGLAALGAAAPAIAVAVPVNEDAELSALFAQFQRISAEWDAATNHRANMEVVYHDIRPAFPQAAVTTEADRRKRLGGTVGDRYGEEDIPRLSQPQRGDEVVTPYPGRPGEVIVRRPVCPEKTARAREIVKALEDYRAADEAARLMSGFGEAVERAEKADRALDEIQARILAVPAKTLAGVIIKARVVEWCYAGDLPEAGDLAFSSSTAEQFAMALTVDLVRITRGQANG